MDTSNNATPKKSEYVPSLDGVRGYAVLLVLLVHGANRFCKGGWIGVDLFFVISGYLITSLLIGEYEKHHTISLKKFYARRFLRLFPVLIAGILLANILWNYSGFTPEGRIKATLSALFYYINFQQDTYSNLRHLWSLAVEEHFYMFWPLTCLYFLFRIDYKKKLWFVIGVLLAVTAFRLYLSYFPIDWGWLHMDSYRSTFSRIDCILLGVIMAIVFAEAKKRNRHFIRHQNDNALLIIYVSLFMAVLFWVRDTSVYLLSGGFILTNLLCGFAVLFAVQHPEHSFFSNKTIGWIVRRSYGIYVYHYPIFFLFNFKNGGHDIKSYVLITLLRLGLTFIIAALSFKYIEQPVLNYKKRFEVN